MIKYPLFFFIHFLIILFVIGGTSKVEEKPIKSTTVDYGNPWTDKQIIETLLKRYRFPESGMNISVSVLLDIEDIEDFGDDKCHLSVLITQKWMEETLKYKDIRDSMNPVNFRTLNYIWNPALTIDNVVSLNPIGKDSVRVFSSGLVEYRHRLKFVLFSEHKLRAFPFESRNCTVRFINDDTRAQWSRLLKITLPATSEGTSDWIAVPGETVSNYHNLRLKLKRSVDHWVCSFFLPTFGLVLASWLPVWMNTGAQISRTAIGAVSFLSILTLVLFRAKDVPSTPYLKAIDYWNIAVCVFSFLSFLQSSLITSHVNSKFIRRRSYEDEEEKAWINDVPYYSQLPPQRKFNIAVICDYVFRIAAPICFGAFVAIFVLTYVLPFWNIVI